MSRVCAACGEQNPGDANWCEACGTDLDLQPSAPKAPCTSCDAPGTEITDDGWCQLCGTKQPAPEDHVVDDHGWFAIVSDRGRVHRTNEDAGAVAARPDGVALVVCDGVSSTDEAQHASQNAARAVIELVASADAADNAGIDQSIRAAGHVAQAAIVEATDSVSVEPASCTLVVVIAQRTGDRARLTVGWLGDSRAYWLAGGTARQLTRDHSWAVEQHELGELEPAAIDADRRAHSITRWLGADSPDPTPEIATIDMELPGIVLVCSDGLWNYAPTEEQMHDVVMADGAPETALERAERLVAFANAQGGHDNITVAIAELDNGPEPSS